MTDLTLIDTTSQLALCPTWHRPLFRITPKGIEIKCKFCGGLIHTISREEIEKQWRDAAIEEYARVTRKQMQM